MGERKPYMSIELNDSLDDLLGSPIGPVRTQPVRSAPAFKPAIERFVENCSRCRGTGQTRWGVCFKCKGAAKKSFKTSPEARAKVSVQRAERKARIGRESLEAWKEANPAEFAWLEATAPRWDLAQSFLNGLKQYGSLSETQIAIIHKGIARDAARAAERAQKNAGAAIADMAGVDRLKAAFDAAIAYSAAKGLKRQPKITVGGMVISPAKAASKNPGALYVKERGTYLGKVADGRFFASRECGPAQQAKVMEFIVNPKEASEVYGQETGTCCICNATLTSEWKLRGIGPICAEKFGW
jgi:hypothetical protein